MPHRQPRARQPLPPSLHRDRRRRPTRGDEIVVDGKVVGAVTSVTPDGVPPVALGYVRREVEPGATVELRWRRRSRLR